MKKAAKGCDLQSCFMCQLSLKEWHPAISGHKKNFIAKKGEVIICEGNPVNGVYFVYDGVFKVHKKWGDKELIVRFANKGSIIGHRGISTLSTTYPISVTALEASVFCFMDLDFFNARAFAAL
ncbi:MAG: cyclic nucleotide-binding domain-containing protein, partial [Pedobacter sp.]